MIFEIIKETDNSYSVHITGIVGDPSNNGYDIIQNFAGDASVSSGIDRILISINKNSRGLHTNPNLILSLGYTYGHKSKISVDVLGAEINMADKPKKRPIVLDTEEDTGGGFTPIALGL